VIPAILFLLAAVLLLLGGQLLVLGGSVYYLASGIVMAVAAIAHRRRSRWSLHLVYALIVLTIIWALFEAGLDFWALLPRTAAWLILGALLSLPFVRRKLVSGPSLPSVGVALAAFVLAFIGLGATYFARSSTVEPSPAQLAALSTQAAAPIGDASDWPLYGNDDGGNRYSPLADITPQNVSKLKVAWTYSFGMKDPFSLEPVPLKVGNSVYACNEEDVVAALDATTGKQLWRFDPAVQKTGVPTCRGVAYYRVPNATGACAERIYVDTRDARLIAVDARTGLRCADFGNGGDVSRVEGLGPIDPGQYVSAAAPHVARGRIVVGGFPVWPGPSGVIRAYDAVTGKLSWAFDVGRPDQHGLPGPNERYTPRTPNNWAPMAYDDALGLVYVPFGSPKPAFYGAGRDSAGESISTSVVALDVETGTMRWKFQTVHHDIWDYDVGSQPLLADVNVGGNVVKALIQVTKRGQIFMLDRATGQPISRVEERPVPQSGHVAGERLSPTQPYSVDMPSLAGGRLTEQMMWGLTPIDQLMCRIKFRQARYEGDFTPLGETPSISYPGFIGGMNWGGASLDRERGILVTTTIQLAQYFRLIRTTPEEGAKMAKAAAGYGAMNGPYFASTPFFMSALNIPCQQPPWGRVSAVDLRSKKLLWSRPLGTARAQGPLGIPSMLPLEVGVPSVGGSLVTRSGLTFIAAATDRKLRALRTDTGEELWSADLPHAGISTPITYRGVDGRQFILIAAGGKKWLAPGAGDTMIAYALEDR
jgi:quinoprotein glucose dehydrogenase